MTGPGNASGGGTVRAADAVCRRLADLGVDCVFGLPGTQNLTLAEALRRSDLRWVVPSHELAAAFMANGYYRSSGRPGVLTTIPGPGFTWALTGLAEARLDSAAVLCVTGVHPEGRGDGGRLQEIPQARVAGPLVKRVSRVASAEQLVRSVARAYHDTIRGEPGPVLLQVEDPVWSESCSPGGGASAEEDDGEEFELLHSPGRETGGTDAVEAVTERLREAERPLLLVGQGAQEGADRVRRLAEALDVPVLLTTSGRGVVPEGHPLAVAMDALAEPAEAVNRLVDDSDLVLVLGCKLGHNATMGFRLRLPAGDLVRVDASREVLESGGPPASIGVVADVPRFLDAVLRRWDGAGPGEVAAPRSFRGAERVPPPRSHADAAGVPEPRVEDVGGMAEFFEAVRRALPPEACLVTDSGLHQMLARRHFRVVAPRTLVTPTNFQSMGYGIPAAVGAALADPSRPVVAVVGDGGLRLSAFELATARDLGLDLTVLVFVDGHYGLIRHQQLAAFGRGSGVDLPGLDLEALSVAMGVPHRRMGSDVEESLARCLDEGGVRVQEVPLEDAAGLRTDAARARLREDVRHALGPGRMERLRSWRARWRRWRE